MTILNLIGAWILITIVSAFLLFIIVSPDTDNEEIVGGAFITGAIISLGIVLTFLV